MRFIASDAVARIGRPLAEKEGAVPWGGCGAGGAGAEFATRSPCACDCARAVAVVGRLELWSPVALCPACVVLLCLIPTWASCMLAPVAARGLCCLWAPGHHACGSQRAVPHVVCSRMCFGARLLLVLLQLLLLVHRSILVVSWMPAWQHL